MAIALLKPRVRENTTLKTDYVSGLPQKAEHVTSVLLANRIQGFLRTLVKGDTSGEKYRF